jgi:hypothetical protein
VKRFLLAVLCSLAVGPAFAGSLDEMISPVSSPTVNEDPRNVTDIRPMYMYTSIPKDFITGGGNYSVVAMQLRVALHERFSFIATKDGYIFLRPHAGVPNNNGFANLAFGFKGSLFQSEEWAAIVSAGLRYEAPTGNTDVLQGQWGGGGSGVINPFLSAAKGFGDFHVQMYTGPRVAISGIDSSYWDFNLHTDYRIPWMNLYPLFEFNLVQTYDGGRRLPIDQEGNDLVNLGAHYASGNTVATTAFGARWRACEWMDFGVTAEVPVTQSEGLLGWRITSDVVIRPFGFKLPPWPWLTGA